MKKITIAVVAVMALMLWANTQPAFADEKMKLKKSNASKAVKETSVLKAEAGNQGSLLGAKVESVASSESSELMLISVMVPVDPAQADQIEIFSSSGKPLAKDRIAQVLKDYENDNVGIKFYFPKKKNWEFKIRFHDDSDQK